MIIQSGASGISNGSYNYGTFEIKTVANNTVLFRFNATVYGDRLGILTCYDDASTYTQNCGIAINTHPSINGESLCVIFTKPMYFEFGEECYFEYSTGDDGGNPFDTAITIIKP